MVKKGGALWAFSREDQDALAAFTHGQILTVSIAGTKKARSYQQLKLWWAACRTVADNTDDREWDTPAKVALQVKIKLGHVDGYLVADGMIQVIPRSISYKELGHLEACQFFEKAWPILAEKIDVTVLELVDHAEY